MDSRDVPLWLICLTQSPGTVWQELVGSVEADQARGLGLTEATTRFVRVPELGLHFLRLLRDAN